MSLPRRQKRNPSYPPVENGPNLFADLRARWQSSELDVPDGVQEAELDEFERRYNIVLPQAMRLFLGTANGSGGMGDDLLDFWPLDRIKPVSEELSEIHRDRYDYPGCFIFADYCMWCWAYAVQLSDDPAADGPVYLVDSRKIVASNFLDFMEKYGQDPDGLI